MQINGLTKGWHHQRGQPFDIVMPLSCSRTRFASRFSALPRGTQHVNNRLTSVASGRDSLRASRTLPRGPLKMQMETTHHVRKFVFSFDAHFRASSYGHQMRKRLRHSSQPFPSALAERTRFELVVGLLLRQFSKLLVSATHPPLLGFG